MKQLFLFFALITCFQSLSAKIYDCFMFSNELGILELRLNELYPYVDHFVLVEWNKTHRTGASKPCYYDLYKDRFAKFSDKIIHIKLEDNIETNNGWIRENWHRNQIMQGLTNAQPDDIIIISDVDEFFPGNAIQSKIVPRMKAYRRICIVHKLYFWFLNRTRNIHEVWPGSGIVYYKDLVKHSPQDVRHWARGLKIAAIWMGWHFTGMGGYETTKEKGRNIVEGHDEVFTYEEWRHHVNHHTLLPIDDSYPQFVKDNIPYLIDIGLIDCDHTDFTQK